MTATHRLSLRPAAVVGALALTLGTLACSDSDSHHTSPTAAAAGAITPIDQATFEATIAKIAEQTKTPGAVALLRTDDGTLTYAWGTRTLGAGEPVTLGDHVRIGSNTKTMTATAILQLAQEGKLSLDDPVSKYRPDVPNGDAITIAMLLNMRSGLYNYSETVELNRTLDEHPTKAWTPNELLALAFAHDPYFPPDGGYHYSNTNTVLLGLIAEQLDRKLLAEIFQDRFYRPLGLTRTSFPAITDNAIPDPHPHGYMYGTNVETMEPLSAERIAAAKAGTLLPKDVTGENPSWGWSAGAAISTIEDLAKWAKALGAGELLDAGWQRIRLDSIRPTVENKPDAAGYGYGIARLGPFLGHTGELPGFSTFMGYEPTNQVALVVWTNLNAAPDGRMTPPAIAIARALISRLYGGTAGGLSRSPAT